jgi:hypothetical protein
MFHGPGGGFYKKSPWPPEAKVKVDHSFRDNNSPIRFIIIMSSWVVVFLPVTFLLSKIRQGA